jgi:hypothetical protein
MTYQPNPEGRVRFYFTPDPDAVAPTVFELTTGEPLHMVPDAPLLLEPGRRGFIVVQAPRRGLHWLRHVPVLRRWATRPEVYPLTVKS